MLDNPMLKNHWEKIYQEKSTDQMSWTQERPALSFQLIQELNLPKHAEMIDVGGGRSALSRLLFHEGYHNFTVLDISEQALLHVKQAFAENAESIKWIATDILDFQPLQTYDLWHDRAVFHFLTEKAHIDRYLNLLNQSVKAGGYLVLATFALDGPEKCSGLPVTRYDATSMTRLLESIFQPIRFETEIHRTPFGTDQSFQYGVFQRRDE